MKAPNSQKEEEGNKHSMVFVPYTDINPHTVMIHFHYTATSKTTKQLVYYCTYTCLAHKYDPNLKTTLETIHHTQSSNICKLLRNN